MKCDENYEKGGGLGICFLVVNPTKYMTLSGKGVVGPLRFSKFPLSDHGVHLKVLQTPRQNSHVGFTFTESRERDHYSVASAGWLKVTCHVPLRQTALLKLKSPTLKNSSVL